MGKKKEIEGKCDRAKLIMKGNPQGYFKNQTKIDFKLKKTNPLYAKVHDQPLFPTFNNDCKFYTPTFILPKVDEFAENRFLAMHEQKVY